MIPLPSKFFWRMTILDLLRGVEWDGKLVNLPISPSPSCVLSPVFLVPNKTSAMTTVR